MRDTSIRHRLTVILAADAVGYTRLMADDDRATLIALDAARNVFQTAIQLHSGRVVDTAGDSVLAVFETANGAVSAALTIQEQLAAHSHAVPADRQMHFRIGIHLGDVLEKPDGTIYGDGVNIAARLQAVSEPGGVTLSHVVHGAVSSRTRDTFEDIGEQRVKNIAEPVRAYRTRRGINGAAAPGGAPAAVTSYRFGRFELRPLERRLLVDDANAPLGAPAFDLLVALAERRERVVSQSELLDLVSPGLVVESNYLGVQVTALRKLLGPEAIATIPGRGFRFTLALAEDGAQRDRISPSLTNPDTAVGPEPFALPAMRAPLLGREEDVRALDTLLARHRLVTLLGAGGIGKTSLALEAAHARRDALRDGVAWVDLAPVSQPSMVSIAVAQALQLPSGRSENPLPALVAGLKPLEVLLVLDNAEHLVEAVAQLADAIAGGAPGVRVLATSQSALKVDGERVFRLGALAVPDSGTSAADAMHHGAVALFVDQAQAADRNFVFDDDNVAGVIELCRQLDGLPLALKLAAARLPMLGLNGIRSRLAERLELLAGNSRSAPSRQQTLRAALDWSHELLAAHEQIVFRRLGVFVGGFTLELAGAVASDDSLDEWAVIDTLAALVERSLVTADGADPPRYRLLESAREYARLRLAESAEWADMQRRHARTMLSFFEKAYTAGWTMSDAAMLQHHGPEVDNLRVALDWSASCDPHLAVDLAGASSHTWLVLGLQHEHRHRCLALEPALPSHPNPSSAARYWEAYARSLGVLFLQTRECGLKAVALYRSIGDARGLYCALCAVGRSASAGGEEPRAALKEAESIEQPGWPARQRVLRLYAQSVASIFEGDYAFSRTAAETAVAVANSVGARRAAALVANLVVAANLGLGNVDEALEMSRGLIEQESRWLGGVLDWSWGNYSRGLLLQGRLSEARLAFARLFECCRAHDWDRWALFVREYTALALAEQRYAAAARLLGFATRAEERKGIRGPLVERSRGVAMATLASALDSTTLKLLLAEGALLDEEAVCALTLEEPPRTGG